ncbi:MAG: hypothetical protein FJ293_15215, partial [Planctomycetes bacterium]|nr:hypothetical protein [Planctomycetota bacterium]
MGDANDGGCAALGAVRRTGKRAGAPARSDGPRLPQRLLPGDGQADLVAVVDRHRVRPHLDLLQGVRPQDRPRRGCRLQDRLSAHEAAGKQALSGQRQADRGRGGDDRPAGPCRAAAQAGVRRGRACRCAGGPRQGDRTGAGRGRQPDLPGERQAGREEPFLRDRRPHRAPGDGGGAGRGAQGPEGDARARAGRREEGCGEVTRRAAATVTLALATAACVGGDDFAADRARVDGEAIERSGAGAGSRWDRLAFAPGAALPEEAVARLGAELEVDDAVALAFACHAGLAAHLERLGVARAELRQAALPRNPVLTASWKFFAGPDEIELTLSQSFLDLLFLPLRRRVAEAGRAAVEAEVIAALVHQAFAVRRAHATALHAVGQYRLARDAAAAALAHAELMDQLHEAGSVVDERRTTAAILAERAADGAAAAEHDRVAAELALARAIGLPVDAPPARVAKVAGSAPQPPLPDALARPDHELVTQATQRSLALAVARARTEAAAARAGVEPAQRWLDPAEVGIAAKRETSGEWGLGPVAALALPLFDLGGNARIAAAAELRRTELDTTALERELARAVQEAAA